MIYYHSMCGSVFNKLLIIILHVYKGLLTVDTEIELLQSNYPHYQLVF